MKKLLLFLLLSTSIYSKAQFSNSDRLFIEKTFKEIEEFVKKDNGALWGWSFNQPVMVINESSREIIANRPDNKGLLTKQGDIYIGKYPENEPIGNSVTQLGGVTYAFISHPYPYPDFYVKVQIVHEIFHIIQDFLNLKPPPYTISHMDNADATIFIKLEWAALEKAMLADNKTEKEIHIANALKFRKKRRLLYPMSVKDENYFEINEGIAEYTGHIFTASTMDEYQESISLIGNLTKSLESISGNYAYYSGCLYGGLLYTYDKDWGKKINKLSDLGILLKDYCGFNNIDTTMSAKFNNEHYNETEITQIEIAKQNMKQEQYLYYKNTFCNDTILEIILIKKGMQIYPTTSSINLDTLGVVHQRIDLYDDWGKLVVKDGGCLINNNYTKALLPATGVIITKNIISTQNWELTLNSNWQIEFMDGKYKLTSK